MKTVGIKDLKNNLSAYLREVRRGTRILVSDRSNIVAELHEPGAAYSTTTGDDVILAAWVAKGEVHLPRQPKQILEKSTVTLPGGTAEQLLAADRGE